MATVQGLNLRGARFYLRVLIPEDLQAAYEGRTRVNHSLGTSDRATAVLHGLRVKAQWLEEFAALRQRQAGAQVGSLTVETLLAQGNGIHLPALDTASAARSKALHVAPTQASTASQKASQQPLQAASIECPAPSSPHSFTAKKKPVRKASAAANGMSMWEVYELWKKAERRAKENEQSYARTLTLAEKCLGAPLHIGSITRAHGNTFRAWLLAPEQAYAPKTCKNHFTNFQSLLRFAHLELEAIAQHPWQGLCVKVPKVITRRPWRDEELHTLFSQPLFQRLELPNNGSRCGALAGYWNSLDWALHRRTN